MIAKPLPSLKTLDRVLSYNPETGKILRFKGGEFKETVKPHKRTGYLWYSINKQVYAGHRLAWKIYYRQDVLSDMEIDHINGDQSDNRISNLRLVKMNENMKNKKTYCSNKSGIVGVAKRSDTNSWRSQISVNGKAIKLGSFKTKDEAISARLAAEKKYGFHPNHGAR